VLTGTDASAPGVVGDDVDEDVDVVVVVGEDPRGAFGRPFPCACATPGSANPIAMS